MKRLLVLLLLLFSSFTYADTINLHWLNYDGTTYQDSTCVVDSDLILPSTPPTKYGYTFTGWKIASYKLITYVQNTENTIVCTGIFPNIDDVEMNIRMTSGPSNTSFYLFQSRSSDNNKTIYGFAGMMADSSICLNAGEGICSNIIRKEGHTYTLNCILKNGFGTLYVKDETTNQEDTVSFTYDNIVPRDEICLFGNTSGNRIASGYRIHRASMKIRNIVVMDYIPVINNGNTFFYDFVTSTYVEPRSGSLIPGPLL